LAGNGPECLHIPESGEWHGKETRIGERERARAGVKKHTALEIFPALVGEATQAVAIGRAHRGRSLDLHAPRLATAGDDEIDLHLVLVTVVPETQIGIGPAGLRNQLLYDVGFEQMAKTVTPVEPVGRGQPGKGAARPLSRKWILGS